MLSPTVVRQGYPNNSATRDLCEPTLLSSKSIDFGLAKDICFADVEWAKPQYSRAQVDEAGRNLTRQDATPAERIRAYMVMNNWRASHSFPMRTMRYATGRYRDRVCAKGTVVQRLKRQYSITRKLRDYPKMRLSQIQDIAGCRAIVDTIDEVYGIQEAFQASQIRHKLMGVDDYIQLPRQSGYRGVHLKYGYISDSNAVYNGHRVEIQIRTPLQHVWATAVETTGTIRRQALKSSIGDKGWLRFFSLMGGVCAIREDTSPIPSTPSDHLALRAELKQVAEQINVDQHLDLVGAALRLTQQQPFTTEAQYFLLRLDAIKGSLSARPFSSSDLSSATQAYADTEMEAREKPEIDAVLVSVDSLEDLEKAFPNYFLDMKAFRKLFHEEIGD